MATVATQVIPVTGLNATYNAASAGGDKVAPGCFLHVKNGSGASINVTLATPGTLQGDLAIDDRVVAVPASGDRFIAVTDDYRDPTDGLAHLAWSASASVTYAVLRQATS